MNYNFIKYIQNRFAEIGTPTLTPEQLADIAAQIPPVDISGKVDKVTGSALISSTEAAKIHTSGSDDQDLSGKVDKVTNYSLVLNTEISKIHSSGSDNQTIPSALADLTDDVTHRVVTDTEKSTWNGKGSSNLVLGDLAANAYYGDKGKTAYDHSQASHAPTGAEVNVNADWNASSGDAQIMNKPSIPAAQVQTDWNASAGMGVLLNKPTISGSNTGDETAARIVTIITGAGAQTTPLDADEFPFYKIVGTILSKVTWVNIKATLKVVEDLLYNPKRLFANLAAPVASSGTTEKVLLQLAIPAARAVVGSTFRAWVVGNSSSTGTLIFRIKCGVNGTISDTEDWKSVTSAAQVANARAGFEVLVTVRSATTVAVDGVGYAGAIQLPTTIAAPATPAIAISGIWYINMTVVCSSGTFTAQVATIEEIR